MKNKRYFRSFFILLAVLVVLCGFSVTAYASGLEGTASQITAETSVPAADKPPENKYEVIGSMELQALTPEGNMSLVDYIQGEASDDKEFIVVQSKSGNYFYIVIDHAAQGANSVHFLNQVDEADLMAIIENGQAQKPPAACICTEKCEAGKVNTDCPVCAKNLSECAGKEAAAEKPDAPKKGNGSLGGIILFFVIALLGGGGALYYFKIMKPKQSAKGNNGLADFDFDEYDEDEPQSEDGQPETDEKQEDKE